MSHLLEKVLAAIERLDSQERLQVLARLAPEWQPLSTPSPTKMSRQEPFGCLRGQIKIADDFNEPLSDFAKYM